MRSIEIDRNGLNSWPHLLSFALGEDTFLLSPVSYGDRNGAKEYEERRGVLTTSSISKTKTKSIFVIECQTFTPTVKL